MTTTPSKVRYLPGTYVVNDPMFCAMVAMQMQRNLFVAEQQRITLANRPYVAIEASARGAIAMGIREGVVKPPRRMTAAERNAAEVQKLYGPRKLLKGEVV